MTDSDLTLTLLREIRDELGATNRRIHATNEQLDSLLVQQGVRIDRIQTAVAKLAAYVQEQASELREYRLDLARSRTSARRGEPR